LFDVLPSSFRAWLDMKATSDHSETAEFQEVCTIVILYDGIATRTRAMATCDYLVRQFWSDVELKFHWWRTDFLQDPTLAVVAAENAAAADFLVIANEATGEISPALESWFESWLARRRDRQGALVDLALTTAAPTGAREQFLREICQRGNFDYLAAFPAGVGSANSSGEVSGGAARLGDDPVDEFRPPTHYGLNE